MLKSVTVVLVIVAVIVKKDDAESSIALSLVLVSATTKALKEVFTSSSVYIHENYDTSILLLLG